MSYLQHQKVREDLGLAYAVYSYLQCFFLEGVQSFYVGTKPNKSLEVTGIILDEIKKLVDDGLNAESLNLYKKQILGEILMGQDDLDTRMNSIAINELVYGEYRSSATVVEEIEKISVEDMKAYFKKKE